MEGGGGRQKGGGGMWDEEDEANNDNQKKKKKHLHFNLEAEGGQFFFSSRVFSLSLFPLSCPCSLHHICVWDFKIQSLLCTVSQYFNVTPVLKLFLCVCVCMHCHLEIHSVCISR